MMFKRLLLGALPLLFGCAHMQSNKFTEIQEAEDELEYTTGSLIPHRVTGAKKANGNEVLDELRRYQRKSTPIAEQ
ncbi:hypothetical protein [Chitinimonas sp.]|uniref:hypothetical protein n=1 Tax=Chitinimonas sp. TaxID=1934313 RepID=UPI0035B0E66B